MSYPQQTQCHGSDMARDDDSDIDALIHTLEKEGKNQGDIDPWGRTHLSGGEGFSGLDVYKGYDADYGPLRYSVSGIVRQHARDESKVSWESSRMNGILFQPCYKSLHRTLESPGRLKTAIAATVCCGITMIPLAAAQHHVPEAVLHAAVGTSLTTSLVVPLLRNSGDLLPPAYLMATYATWGAAFAAHLVCESLRRSNSLQRRLLGGTVLFSALNLLGTLSQSASSTLEGILSWGPLALTASLCVIPVVMELINPREAAVMVANLAGIHVPAQTNAE